jgi:hypothetical protein
MERVTILPVLGLTVASWAVFLGGLAALQHSCSDDDTGFGTADLGLVDGFSGNALPCSNVYRFWWFIVAFEFVLVVLLALTAIGGKAFSTRGAFIGLFAVATMLYILAAQAFLTMLSVSSYKHGSAVHKTRAATAGAIMTAFCNCLLLIALGHPGAEEGHGVDKHTTEQRIPTVIQTV